MFKSVFSKLKQGLSKSKERLGQQLSQLLLGKKKIDAELLESLETLLLTADLGVEVTENILKSLTAKVDRHELQDSDALYQALSEDLCQRLQALEKPLVIPTQPRPFVILVVGVNGVGKTTTIGKLASQLKAQGHRVMLAAGDTFRAAAVEQLEVWGERLNIPVISQSQGSDSASVIYDALHSAKAREMDVLIADTAGRLHNKDHLMQELAKIVRVMKKLDPEAPHEVLLVLDAGSGQNALSQAKVFQSMVGVTGLALTKLDGTAKGGILFALAESVKLPIRCLGVGEQVEDLQGFDAKDFTHALLGLEE